MTVASSIQEITGPTYITTKATNTYTASHAANWFERMTGEAAWRFNGVTDTSMNRIWALGNYHVDLRADSSTTSNLLRGRLGIDVCATNCTPENSLLMASRSAPPLLPDIFGGGPVLASATGQLVRGYDLTGMHEQGSPFRSPDWLENTEWRAFDALGYRLEWRREPQIVGGVHAFTFRVLPAAAGAYQFGFALDPDLGTVAWDDRAEYDGSRQLLIVRDGQRALGVMLLRTGQPVDVLPRQFGTVVFAPTSAAGITMELRNPGRRLFNRQDDVQVLLRGGSADGESAWKLLLVEAATPAHVQQLVDGYRAVSR